MPEVITYDIVSWEPLGKTLTRKWMEDHEICDDGMACFDDFERRGITSSKTICEKMAVEGHPDYSHWLLMLSISQKERAEYVAKFAVEILKKTDVVPRYFAMREAALKWDSESTEENFVAMGDAARQAYSRIPIFRDEDDIGFHVASMLRLATSHLRDMDDENVIGFNAMFGMLERNLADADDDINLKLVDRGAKKAKLDDKVVEDIGRGLNK